MPSSEPVPSGTPGHPGPEDRRLFSWKAAVPAALIVLALVGAVLVVVLWSSDNASASQTDVYMDSEGKRFVFTVGSVEILSEADGETQWVSLDPEAGERDTRDGPVRVARGSPEKGTFTQARVTFTEVEAVQGSSLNSLRLLDDTVHITLDEAGSPGDALLIEFNGEASLQLMDDLWSFKPTVKSASWHAGYGASGAVPTSSGGGSSPPTTGGGGSGGGDGGGGDGGTGGGGGSGGDGGDGDDGDPGPVNIGRLTVAFQAETLGTVESLQARVHKIALTPEDDPEDTKVRFQGKKTADLVQAADEDDGVWIAEFQVPAGNYSALHLEFDAAHVQLNPLIDGESALVPQPLLVLESAFTVPAGENVTASARFSVEESLRLGAEGYEFRPVVTSFTATGNHSGDQLAPYPPQYRAGGTWLPLLGERTHDFLSENVTDPYAIPHPLWGDVERPPWAEGSLADIQPPQAYPYESCFAGGTWCLSISLMSKKEVKDDPLSPLDDLSDDQSLVHDRALVVPWDPQADTDETTFEIEITEGSLRLESQTVPRINADVPMLLPQGEGDLDPTGLFPVDGGTVTLDYRKSGTACADDQCRFTLVDPTTATHETQQRAIGELRYAQIQVNGPATLSVKEVPVVVLKQG